MSDGDPGQEDWGIVERRGGVCKVQIGDRPAEKQPEKRSGQEMGPGI